MEQYFITSFNAFSIAGFQLRDSIIRMGDSIIRLGDSIIRMEDTCVASVFRNKGYIYMESDMLRSVWDQIHSGTCPPCLHRTGFQTGTVWFHRGSPL